MKPPASWDAARLERERIEAADRNEERREERERIIREQQSK